MRPLTPLSVLALAMPQEVEDSPCQQDSSARRDQER
jgi:hypothetical protein